ncbi:catalase-like domain-containing protein [Aspergillus carlsbadensis]|nr:catalase-like domain-containing protein [Aspergillus carlsbadensis]
MPDKSRENYLATREAKPGCPWFRIRSSSRSSSTSIAPRTLNANGEFVYIKCHLLAEHGHKRFTADEALKYGGEDTNYSKRELWRKIENGPQLTWTAHIQTMQPKEADPSKLGLDPFDVTKLHEFGRLVLNKNPENFHRDVEQAAVSPGSMVPGIEDSPDPLLQFRMFFYRDAQYRRIGINLHQVPVNCPFMASSYSSLNFDGQLRVDANHAMNHQLHNCKSHFFHEGKDSEYEQGLNLYMNVMDAQARQYLHANTTRLLKLVE